MMRSTPTEGRPAGVFFSAALAIILGLGHLAFAYWALFWLNAPLISHWTAVGVGMGALGLVYLYVAVGLLELEAQRWWLGILASIASAIFGGFWLANRGFSTVAFSPVEVLAVILVIVFPTSLIVLRGHFGIGSKVTA